MDFSVFGFTPERDSAVLRMPHKTPSACRSEARHAVDWNRERPRVSAAPRQITLGTRAQRGSDCKRGGQETSRYREGPKGEEDALRLGPLQRSGTNFSGLLF